MTSIQDLLNFFPEEKIEYKSQGEVGTPCPFCSPSGKNERTLKNNIMFMGSDRLIWREDWSGVWCRHCGFHSYFALAAKIGYTQIFQHIEFDHDTSGKRATTSSLILETEEFVQERHNEVQRDYWAKFGWSDEIVDRFKLGYGQMYRYGNREPRHLIPFIPYTLEGPKQGYAFEARLNSRAEEEMPAKPYNKKTVGLVGNRFFWLYETGQRDEGVAICEGMKDPISAYAAGFKNVFSPFSTSGWTQTKADYLYKLGYRKFYSFGDNDDAGKEMNVNVQKYLSKYPDVEVFVFTFPADCTEGYDLTDYYRDYGSVSVIMGVANAPANAKPFTGFIDDLPSLYPDYQKADPTNAAHYTEIRRNLPLVINDFVDRYKDRIRRAGKGVVKVLATPPGSGKSYQLVRLAESEARKKLQEVEGKTILLDQAIEEAELELENADDQTRDALQLRLDRVKRKKANLKTNHVLFAGPFINGWDDIVAQGADQSLWYNFQSRNRDNCQRLFEVESVAQKGYTAMSYCKEVCPFLAECKKTGYLAQDEVRKSTPITYVRHQNLATGMAKEYKVVIIDENPSSVFEEKIVVKAESMYPLLNNWKDFLPAESGTAIETIINSLRLFMNTNIGAEGIISGKLFFDSFNTFLQGQLTNLLNVLDDKSVEYYQPDSILGAEIETLPNRVVPTLLRVLKQESELWLGGTEFNSKIALINGKIEVFNIKKFEAPKSHPILIADGTAFPELYKILFNRELEVYAPDMFSALASTTVWWGSDFTKSAINRQLGYGIKDYDSWVKSNNVTIEDVLGGSFDLSTIPSDENLYDSSILSRMLTLIKGVVESHKKTLVVTYKNIRLLIEKRLTDVYPDLVKTISFAHYGSLRGTNRYIDHDSVILIGCYRQPYEQVHRRVQAWSSMDANIGYIPYELSSVTTPYHGTNSGFSHITLQNSFAQQFVDMVEVGEVRQCLDRIRLYSSDTPKYAYLAMSRPVAKYITHLDSVNKIADNFTRTKDQLVTDYLTNYYSKYQKFPTYADVSKQFRISSKKISELRGHLNALYSYSSSLASPAQPPAALAGVPS